MFTKGHTDYFWDVPNYSIGHVGIYTGNSVIHAASKTKGVIESTIEDFTKDNFLLIKRIHPNFRDLDTITCPVNNILEYNLHLRWKILQNIKL